VVVLVQLLKDVGIFSCISKIQLTGPQIKEDRLKARSAIVYLTSSFYKNEAVIRIKGLLLRHRLHEVIVEDCFPSEQMERARSLKNLGQTMKNNGLIAKYRVLNRLGVPVLQTASRQADRFRDHRNTAPNTAPPPTTTTAASRLRRAASPLLSNHNAPLPQPASMPEPAASTTNTSTPPTLPIPSSVPDTGLSMGGNVCLATSTHQTESRETQQPTMEKEINSQDALAAQAANHSPRSLHHAGGERQRPRPLTDDFPPISNSDQGRRLMSLANYPPPHSDQGTSKGARPRTGSYWLSGPNKVMHNAPHIRK
jgi:hypothetical protein